MRLLDLEPNRVYIPILPGRPIDFNVTAIKLVDNEFFMRDMEGQWLSIIESAKSGSDITLKYLNQFDYIPLYGRERYEERIANKTLCCITYSDDIIKVGVGSKSFEDFCHDSSVNISWNDLSSHISLDELNKIANYAQELKKLERS